MERSRVKLGTRMEGERESRDGMRIFEGREARTVCDPASTNLHAVCWHRVGTLASGDDSTSLFSLCEHCSTLLLGCCWRWCRLGLVGKQLIARWALEATCSTGRICVSGEDVNRSSRVRNGAIGSKGVRDAASGLTGKKETMTRQRRCAYPDETRWLGSTVFTKLPTSSCHCVTVLVLHSSAVEIDELHRCHRFSQYPFTNSAGTAHTGSLANSHARTHGLEEKRSTTARA